MNPILSDIFQTNTVITPNGQPIALHSQLPQLEGRLLQYWLAQYRPKQLLEIGFAYGISSLFICEVISAWPTEHYHIIDAFQSSEWQNIGINNLKRAGYGDLFILHEQLSELCLPNFLQQGVRFDFAFIDGWHTFDHVLLEFFYLNRMLKVGGIILFDDIHLPAIQKVIKYIETYSCYKRLEIPTDILSSTPMKVRKMVGLPLSRIDGFVKTAHDDRNWDWFKEF